MSVQVNVHPKIDKDNVIMVQELQTESGKKFPVIHWGFELAIYPTMEQLEELHTKISEFLKAQEVAE